MLLIQRFDFLIKLYRFNDSLSMATAKKNKHNFYLLLTSLKIYTSIIKTGYTTNVIKLIALDGKVQLGT